MIYSVNEDVHGLQKRVHLSHEGRQSSDDRGHGRSSRSTSHEAEELPWSTSQRRSELRRGSLYRVHQELASHR